MTVELQPYPEYKDSGPEWLGQIPAHWDCLPNRALFEEIKDQGHVDEPLLSVTISKGLIRQSDLLAGSSKKDSSNLDKSKYKLVVPGDIAYNKMRTWQGAVGVSRHRGIVSPAYIVIRLRNSNNPEYFHFLFRTPAFATEAERWSYGITSDQWSLRAEHFKMIYSCVPPMPEQDAIMAFLQHFDVKVRRFIRNRRRLIGVLNEQKQAIINRAVTRGLDPDVPLKPSGSKWFGNIPAHWKVLRLKHLLSGIDQGVSPQAENRLADASNWGVLKAGCVNRGVFRPKEHKRLPAGFKIDKDIVVRAGDVLVSRACGSPDLVGSVAKVAPCEYQLILSDKTFRLRFKQQEIVDFYVTVMNARYFRNQVRLAISGAGGLANNLPLSSLRNFVIAVPPHEEAQSIHAAVADKVFPLNRAAEKAEREIDLIREYRTRLIADVVTGKVDVRHLAPLPEAMAVEAEPEDLDEGLENEMPGEDEAELAQEGIDADD